MKTLTKILGTSILSLALFLSVAVVASAATPAQTLQPTHDITYTETVIVPSIKVGAQGVGGVTFFNGTIVNSTTDADTGDEMPVTFGDDVRIDGRVFRGATAGTSVGDSKPFIINDNAEVAGSLSIGSLSGTGVVNSTNILDGTIAAADLASSSVTSAKIVDGTITGSDISSSADLSIDTVTANTIMGDGAARAHIVVDSDGTVLRSWTYDGSSISVTVDGAGYYSLDYGFDVDDRYVQATVRLGSYSIGAFHYNSDADDILRVYTYRLNGVPGLINQSFTVTVY